VRLVAKTFHGLEQVLANELKALGVSDIQPLKRAVSFEGGQELMYKCNMHLRTALRILKPIYSFEAETEQQLYDKMFSFDWSEYFKIDQTFAIDSVVFSDHFTHSKYVALKAKDAIADCFRKKYSRRPSVDVDNPDCRINIHTYKKQFTISLDSSGFSLHKRGYREEIHLAPLNEVLAAGMLLISDWNPETTLYDPMCGSGTNLMEAAMIACKIPPGIKRNKYGFMGWADYDQKLWNGIVEEAKANIVKPRISIYGSDISQKSIDITKMASLNLGVNQQIKLERCSFKEVQPKSESGLLIMNPPYGERMERNDITAFYNMIGDSLKGNWAGHNAWIISSNKDALKYIGLRPSHKHTLYNGPLECKFQCFSMYQGSKKAKNNLIHNE